MGVQKHRPQQKAPARVVWRPGAPETPAYGVRMLGPKMGR